MGLGRHLLVFAALVVNLWVGGDLVEAAAGGMARVGFEALLILGYLWFVIGLGGLTLRTSAAASGERGSEMNRHEMMAKIGSGVGLRTAKHARLFEVRAERRGLVFVPESSGLSRPPVPWSGDTGIEHLYGKWEEAGMPPERTWLRDMSAGPARFNASYLHAAFHFFAGRIKAEA